PTRSWCSTTANSASRAPTPNSSPSTASTPSSTASRVGRWTRWKRWWHDAEPRRSGPGREERGTALPASNAVCVAALARVGSCGRDDGGEEWSGSPGAVANEDRHGLGLQRSAAPGGARAGYRSPAGVWISRLAARLGHGDYGHSVHCRLGARSG